MSNPLAFLPGLVPLQANIEFAARLLPSRKYSKTPVGGAYHYNYADYFLDFKTTATDPSYQGEGVTESPAYDDADAGTIVEACD